MVAYFLKNPFKPAFELICFLNFYLCMLKKIPQKGRYSSVAQFNEIELP